MRSNKNQLKGNVGFEAGSSSNGQWKNRNSSSLDSKEGDGKFRSATSLSGRRMSVNQGIVNRQTFGLGTGGRNPMAPIGNRIHQNSKEDLSSDDPDMHSFNQMSNGYFKRDLQKQRSATIHIRSTSRIKNERGGTAIEEEELQ